MYNKMITMRLLWVLDNVEGLREAADRNEVSCSTVLYNLTKTVKIMFGCVDSWLLYKLTGKHITEGEPSQPLQTQLDTSLTS